MQIPILSTQLQEDVTQAVPPFGAESIKIARRLGTAATSFLLEQIRTQGNTAFLALEALRVADQDAYNHLPGRERAEIYVNALRNNVFYNSWGLPGYQLSDTSYALISLKEDAVPLLIPLLSDQRPAPLSGSEDATTSTMYENRVCDYAWVFISEIREQSYTYSQHPVERDRAIETLRQELSGGNL